MNSEIPPEGGNGHPPAGGQQPYGQAGPYAQQGPYPQQQGYASQPPESQPQPGAGQPAPAGRSAAGRSSLIPGAIGLVAGLVLGVLAGALFSGSSSGIGASSDVSTACRYVAALSEDFDPETIGVQDPTMWRLQAVAGLAQAAALADPDYQAFGEQGMDLYAAASRVDVEGMQASLQAMDETCQHL